MEIITVIWILLIHLQCFKRTAETAGESDDSSIREKKKKKELINMKINAVADLISLIVQQK